MINTDANHTTKENDRPTTPVHDTFRTRSANLQNSLLRFIQQPCSCPPAEEDGPCSDDGNYNVVDKIQSMFQYPGAKAKQRQREVFQHEQENQQQEELHPPPQHQQPYPYQNHLIDPPPLTIPTISQWFQYYDTDHSESLERDELISGVIRAAPKNDAANIADAVYALWSSWDVDGDGRISVDEFCRKGGLGEEIVRNLNLEVNDKGDTRVNFYGPPAVNPAFHNLQPYTNTASTAASHQGTPIFWCFSYVYAYNLSLRAPMFLSPPSCV
mmetsp:Transcript_62371/g.75063  ORF Transcript_62371/g.75063 Transcript_62371/m.75063 type:complete len:270 (+) Transcript_62371:32-841(+)